MKEGVKLQEVVRKVLKTALRNGSDLAEVYLEYQETLSMQLDDGRLENPSQGNDIGGDVRGLWIENGQLTHPVNEVNIALPLDKLLKRESCRG